VRPTAEALRERAMELVAEDLEDARVLDLFAGSGALGLEALSRGAAYADFVENHPSALHALKANVALVRARERIRVFKKDAVRSWRTLEAARTTWRSPTRRTEACSRCGVVRRWLEVPFARLLRRRARRRSGVAGPGTRHAAGDSALTLYRARKKPR
jgi:16S rRNA (guanine966-N2)-methyltransferase